LEDALLHSGQFKEALQAVLDWLNKMEPQLGDDQLVHGDTDTVGGLREEHTVSHPQFSASSVACAAAAAAEMLSAFFMALNGLCCAGVPLRNHILRF